MDHSIIKRMVSMRNMLLLVYTLLGLALFGIACVYFISSNNTALNRQSVSFTAGSSSQSHRSVESFCAQYENASSIIYAHPDAEKFYPRGTEPTAEEIEKISEITKMLSSSTYLIDYADMGVLYSNDMSAGLVSDGLRDCLGQDEFAKAEEFLGGQEEAWKCFLDAEVPRACFFKRINQNALYVASFYISSLDTIFGDLHGTAGLAVYITDTDNRLIYNTDTDDRSIGDELPEKVSSVVSKPGAVVSASELSACMLELDTGWKIYSVIYHEGSANRNRMTTLNFVLILTVSIIVVFIVIGVIVSAVYLSTTRTPAIASGGTDELTGLISGYYCEEHISDVMESALIGGTWAFVLVKIKDYELIRSRLGDEFADSAVKSLADLLKDFFENNSVVGVNDKSEFLTFADYSDYDIFKAHDFLHTQLDKLCTQFDKLTVGGEEGTLLGVGMGACIYPDDGGTFDELYFSASEALELSMEEDTNVCVFYNQSRTGGR